MWSKKNDCAGVLVPSWGAICIWAIGVFAKSHEVPATSCHPPEPPKVLIVPLVGYARLNCFHVAADGRSAPVTSQSSCRVLVLSTSDIVNWSPVPLVPLRNWKLREEMSLWFKTA